MISTLLVAISLAAMHPKALRMNLTELNNNGLKIEWILANENDSIPVGIRLINNTGYTICLRKNANVYRLNNLLFINIGEVRRTMDSPNLSLSTYLKTMNKDESLEIEFDSIEFQGIDGLLFNQDYIRIDDIDLKGVRKNENSIIQISMTDYLKKCYFIQAKFKLSP
ncbi:MAG: hypothetical protein JXQ87_12800 [Bacteroidia bacterium]